MTSKIINYRVKKRYFSYLKKIEQLAVLLLFLGLASYSHALTIESVVNRSVVFLQGPLAKAVGLMAIICSGYLCIIKQKLPKEQFGMILLGMGIIFGATSLYSALIG